MANVPKFAVSALLLAIASGGGFYLQQATQSHETEGSNSPIDKPLNIGDFRPEFSLPDLNGQMHTHSEWDGKTVLINFWASWCPPCVREIPAFQTIYDTYREKGVEVIGIAFDSPKNIRSFLADVKVTYPILHSQLEVASLMKKLGNYSGALPYTVAINSAGKIASVADPGELNYEQIAALLEPLL